MKAHGTALVRTPALDGLRGLAIIFVMVHHMAILRGDNPFDAAVKSVMNIGWFGVDLFFVLSGFLITRILLDLKESPAFFRTFWTRRVLRIFPLYYALLLLCFFVLPTLPHSKLANFSRIEGSEAWYWLFAQNIPIALHGFRHGILDVTWSLAIEEQFYFVWPFVVRFTSTRVLSATCIFLLFAGNTVRVGLILAGIEPFGPYVLTPAHMDGLLVGALVAIAFQKGTLHSWRLYAPRILAGSLAVLAVLFVSQDFTLRWENRAVQIFGFPALSALFGSILLLVLATPDAAKFSILRSRWLGVLGKFSFAMYLFHLPIRAAIRDIVYGPDQFLRFAGSAVPGQLIFLATGVAATLAMGWVSWHLYEKHFLALGRTTRPPLDAAI